MKNKILNYVFEQYVVFSTFGECKHVFRFKKMFFQLFIVEICKEAYVYYNA